jgi:Protein of unknown function (DUF3631)
LPIFGVKKIMTLKNLSRFLPDFMRKSGKSKPKPVLTVTAPQPEPEPTGPTTKPQKMLEDVCAFLARYLQCSQHQRTVLALWILHTWCFAAARSTPYLAVQSSRKLSGKTLCLRLLSLLCSNPALTSGYTASALVKRIHSHPSQLPTFLLDEAPATVGSRSRSKNPKLRAILVSGFQPGIGYSDRSVECTIYSPKAFASIGPLPEALADCSIPIVLQQAGVAQPPGSPARAGVARDGLEAPSAVSSVMNPAGPQPSPANDQIERFDLLNAQEEAKPLIAALQKWSEKNLSALKALPAYKRKDFPERLTSRGQDIVEPLLQIADAVGGDYPARARQALVAMFDDVGKEQREIALQLLRDIRHIFQHYGWPDVLPTAVLLDELRALPGRPWEIDGPITKHTLAKILRPFEIRPRMLRSKLSKGASSGARGYLLEQFVTVWKDLLDTPQAVPKEKQSGPRQTPVAEQARVAQSPGSPARAGVARDGVEVPGSPARAGVARDGVEVPGSPARAGVARDGVEVPGSPARASVARDGVEVPLPLSSTVNAVSSASSSATATATAATKQEIPNKDAGCCNVAETRIDPRIKGILEDPRNFYLEYPEDHKKNALGIITKFAHWPQPADDKGPADVILPLSDGVEMPYTRVNRDPWDPTGTSSYSNKRERWPVLLTDQEKAQLAVARFFEIHPVSRAWRQQKQQQAANNREQVSSAVS